MKKNTAKMTMAPGYRRYNKGLPPSLQSSHPEEFPSIVGNIASDAQRRDLHTFLNNSMPKETS